MSVVSLETKTLTQLVRDLVAEISGRGRGTRNVSLGRYLPLKLSCLIYLPLPSWPFNSGQEKIFKATVKYRMLSLMVKIFLLFLKAITDRLSHFWDAGINSQI